ncbi:hypothetical protein EOD39_21219 [Acipenser ruthenus]|uniref:Uncharacterized protein n=1 Tax=Acipenser ruthenus TaxID=7906 RepID=A0A444UTA5_ACIRT|nr:hypothetical protein EOD39_21219 [Acipenser ruthenus]
MRDLVTSFPDEFTQMANLGRFCTKYAQKLLRICAALGKYAYVNATQVCADSAENLSKFIVCVNSAGKYVTRSRIHGLKSLQSRAASQEGLNGFTLDSYKIEDLTNGTTAYRSGPISSLKQNDLLQSLAAGGNEEQNKGKLFL